MRQFTTDAPEFFSFQLEGSDKVYKIPLAASMPVKVLLSIDGSLQSQMAMLEKYMGDAAGELSASTVGEILKAWSQASKDQGASVGESKASSD